MPILRLCTLKLVPRLTDATLLWRIHAKSGWQLSWDGLHGNVLRRLCKYSGWSGAVKRKRRQRYYSTCEGTKMLCELVICVRLCIFIGRYSYFITVVGEKKCLAWSLVSLTNQQSPSVVMTTSTSLLPISSSAVARETRSASAWWQASHKSSRTPVGLGFVAK